MLIESQTHNAKHTVTEYPSDDKIIESKQCNYDKNQLEKFHQRPACIFISLFYLYPYMLSHDQLSPCFYFVVPHPPCFHHTPPPLNMFPVLSIFFCRFVFIFTQSIEYVCTDLPKGNVCMRIVDMPRVEIIQSTFSSFCTSLKMILFCELVVCD